MRPRLMALLLALVLLLLFAGSLYAPQAAPPIGTCAGGFVTSQGSWRDSVVGTVPAMIVIPSDTLRHNSAGQIETWEVPVFPKVLVCALKPGALPDGTAVPVIRLNMRRLSNVR